MTAVITDRCRGVCDTGCVDVCPMDCIHGPVSNDELRAMGDERTNLAIQLFVDPKECIDCGACLPECPVEAIFFDEDVPPEHYLSIDANKDFFKIHA
ncbi:MAG: ferredoxin family protein [Myxococcota bacterium]